MAKKFYITTPIYYVNDKPHIGHTCTTLAADILARYHKLKGEEVFFLTGTDEHGAKVAEAAAAEGISPKEFCDKVSQTFSQIWPKLDIQYDFFIRTTNPEHEKIVQEVLTKIYQKGDIYKAKYEGAYCVGCEKFINEGDLVNGRCPLHPNQPIEIQSEENWFFRLSKYVPTLIEAIEKENHPYHYEIAPESKKNEVLAKLKAGVKDLSISRAQVTWGIPVPWDETQTIYVWVDALLNYYTATRITGRENFWPADLHLIAKDILWFHTVIWEALLLAADLPLPKKIFIHNFYSVDGQKMSKSLGNVISPEDLREKFGVDGSRYLIASSFPAFADADVGLSKFREKYNSDLADGLGNLVSRIAGLAKRSEITISNQETTFVEEKLFEQKMNEFDLSGALAVVWEKVNQLNKKINELKLWTKKKEDLEKDLPTFIEELRKIAVLLSPFMPTTSQKILEQFKGPKITKQTLLFPKIIEE